MLIDFSFVEYLMLLRGVHRTSERNGGFIRAKYFLRFVEWNSYDISKREMRRGSNSPASIIKLLIEEFFHRFSTFSILHHWKNGPPDAHSISDFPSNVDGRNSNATDSQDAPSPSEGDAVVHLRKCNNHMHMHKCMCIWYWQITWIGQLSIRQN